MKKAIVVDLDKTLLSINTFKYYILSVMKYSIKNFQFNLTFSLVLWIILRKFRIISHEYMKYKILKISEYVMDDYKLSYFTNSITKFLNKDVYKLIEYYRQQNYFTCLSSAAPINYTSKLANLFYFEGVCATPMPSQVKNREWKENVRQTKKNNTLRFLQEKKCSIEIVITDHYDDIPLLTIDKYKNIIVAPTKKTIKLLEENKIRFELI